jgi:GNAT superfamily N-acetyltransferase
VSPERLTDPGPIAELFEQDRHTHLYGLADLEEPFWSRSTWYRSDDSVVGVIGLGDGYTTGYAMSENRPMATLELLSSVQSSIPAGSTVVGAVGLSARLAGERAHQPLGVHHRMILGELRPTDPRGAVILGEDDLPALEELHSSTGGQGFFLPAMLRGMPFMGVWENDRLISSAGCHVVSKRHGVAAVGAVVTTPDRRGRGLGSAVTSALCERLVGEFRTIGLNVSVTNTTAIGIYQRLGFQAVLDYEEVVVR